MSPRLQQRSRLGIEQLERREMLSSGMSGLLERVSWGVGLAATDDYSNAFAEAAAVSLSSAGSGSQSGKIEQAGDVDLFRIVAPVSGQMTIRQAASSGSRLDSYLYVYDTQEQLLSQNDDTGFSLNSQVTIRVTAGETYYIKAAAYGTSTGSYTVQVGTAAAVADDFGNAFASATTVNLSNAGSGSQSGKIEQAGDADLFRIVAPVSGQMTIRQVATSGSRLDSYLYAFDTQERLLAQNDDTGSSLNSQVTIDVTAGAAYYFRAAAYGRSTGDYTLQWTTVATTSTPDPTSTPSTGNFQIDVAITGMTSAQQQIIQQAVDRWEQIIVGDLPDAVYRGRVIDDLAIDISGIRIDGSGGVLGQATATGFRSGSSLPYYGYIQLDTADVASMQQDGTLLGVIEHEIAHVLGFGVLWSNRGLLAGANTSNPRFTGARATAEYNALFGTSQTSVPVEADGGSGTRLAHWDESLFGNELMTGWYNSGRSNPISRITVASLADLGYQVNMGAADSYSRPTSSSAYAALAQSSGGSRSSVVAGDTGQYRRATDRTSAIDWIMESSRPGCTL